MKNIIRKVRIISIVLVLALLSGALTACKENGNGDPSDNRESTVTGETMNTVNPDVSEPNQSIASDALITTETTETTIEQKNGNTYVINGVEFTISHPIEDYVYTLPGSDLQFIDLDGFMESYGFHKNYTDERREFGDSYKNDGGVGFKLDIYDFSSYNSAIGVCGGIKIAIDDTELMDGAIGEIRLGTGYTFDTNSTYGVNGYISEKTGKLRAQYCLTQETLVVMAIVAEDYNATGTTDSAVDLLSDACIVGPQGQRMVVEIY